MRVHLILFLLLTYLFSLPTKAQNPTTGAVKGFVYDKNTGEPIAFTNVFLKGTTIGASTDVNGYYSISRIQPGTYTLMSTFLGYDTASVQITITAGALLTHKLFIKPSNISLQAVEISAEKENKQTRALVSVETVTAKQINQLPSVGGEPDIAQYLQVLPGVIFTGDQGGQLYIRGGSPVMNRISIDGMLIYNPFHSIGLFSVFETELIRNADVYTAGFNAEYGGRISAVMDVTTRDGNKNELKGKVSASPFMGRLVLEGPIGKPAEGKNLPTFVLAGKQSYLDQTSRVLYPYATESGNIPFSFQDIYGKISLTANNGSKVNFFGFNFNDLARIGGPSNRIGWNSLGLGANFVLIPENSTTLIKGSFAYSDYDIEQVESDGLPRQSSIDGFNGGLNFTYFIGRDELMYGIDLIGFRTNFQFFNPASRFIQQEDFNTELAGFFKYRLVKNKWVLEPGLRLHYYASFAEASVEPRFAFKYNLSENIRLKAAGGFYSQNLMAAVSDRDVVNLFYGFLTGPDNLPRTFDGNDVNSRLQKSQHAIAGVEVDLTNKIELNFETYIKNFSQLSNLNRDKIYDDTPEFADKPEFQRKDFIIERGKAYGFDTRLKYEYKKLYVWLTYSLAWVDRFDGIRTYFPHFDRRHNINLVTTYNFGKDRNWEFSGRWNYGSGFPFTPTQGFYEQLGFENINANYLNQNGQLGIVYGELNSRRLPQYHRLDVTLKNTQQLSDKVSLEIVASATNLYNRDNIFYFDRVRFTRVNQLPIIPSLGLTLNF